MKIHLPILICFCFCNIINAQQITVEAYNDSYSTEVNDQVIIGFDPEATIGLNAELGEVDITDEPIGEYSLRVVQRSQDTYDCMVDTAGNMLVYPNHIESKIDLRNPNEKAPSNAYFEIVPNNVFLGGFSLDLSNYHSPDAPSSYLNLATKTECEDIDFSFFLALGDPELLPFHIYNIVVTPIDVNFLNEPNTSDIPYFKKLYIHMEQDILNNTSTTDELEISGIAFPNPTSGNATIDWCGSVELISISGQSLILDNSSDCTKYFDLNYLPAGAYFIKLTDEKNKYQMTLKLMKI